MVTAAKKFTTKKTVPNVERAAKRIQGGGIVAFPTETVYGLGANALDAKAVAKIFAAKGRPADNPLIVHVSDERMLQLVAGRVSPQARALVKKFWPGPLTLLFPKRNDVPSIVTAGLPTVAVRMPRHETALALIRAAGVPIAAPSANKSGKPSPTSAAHVRADFGKSLLVLDGGQADHGLESTVVSLDGAPKVLRLGAISVEELKKAVPTITVASHAAKKPASPGMKYKHYAPEKPLILFSAGKHDALRRYAKTVSSPVILCKADYVKLFVDYPVVSLGVSDEDVARNLFSALRTKQGKTLLVLGVPKRGVGRAVMDRLERAATKIIS